MAKKANKLSAVLLRAAVLAVIFPMLKGVYLGWAALAANFPGRGGWPYLFSAMAFIVVFLLLGWALGTAPVKWFKKGIGTLWRYLVLKEFSTIEGDREGGGSWKGKEIAYAEVGNFGEGKGPSAFSLGVVTEDSGDWVCVFMMAPPGGTARFPWVLKDSGLVELTHRSIEEHAKHFITLGNGVNPQDFLPGHK